MRQLILVLSIAYLLPNTLAAQYQLEAGVAEYEKLVDDTLLHDDTWSTFDDFPIDLGFEFQLIDHLDSRAWVVAGLGIVFKYEGAVTSSEYLILPLEFSLIDRLNEEEGSSITYVTDGTPGSRITKIQFENAAFLHRSAETDFINFQVWLYESTNVVEFRYGPQSIEDISVLEERESQELAVGIMDKFLLPEESYGLNGNPDSPELMLYNWEDEERPNLAALPGADTYYRLTPGNLSAESIRSFSGQISVFPNPAHDRFQLNTDLEFNRVLLFDTKGRLVHSWNSPRGWLTIPPGFSGTGILKIYGDFGVAAKLLVRR